MDSISSKAKSTAPWNKDRVVGQKLPLKLREIWGDSHSSTTVRAGKGPGAVQPRYR
jgi:hypothetical protein